MVLTERWQTQKVPTIFFIHLSSKYFFIDLRINSALEIILSHLNFSSNCSIKFLSKSTDIHL